MKKIELGLFVLLMAMYEILLPRFLSEKKDKREAKIMLLTYIVKRFLTKKILRLELISEPNFMRSIGKISSREHAA